MWATDIDLTTSEINSVTNYSTYQDVGVLIGNYSNYDIYKSAHASGGSSYSPSSDSFKLGTEGIKISNNSDAFLAGILTNDSTLQFDFTTQSITITNTSDNAAGAQVAGFAYTSNTEFGGKIKATGADESGSSTYSVTGQGNAYGFIFATENMDETVGLSGAKINLANTVINVTKYGNVAISGIDRAYGFLAGDLENTSEVQLGDITVVNNTTNTSGIYTYGFSAGDVDSTSKITLNDVSSTGNGNFVTGVHLGKIDGTVNIGEINGTVNIGNITAKNTNANIKSQVYGFTAGEINKNVTIESINVDNVSTDNGATTYGFNANSITSDATVNVGNIEIESTTASNTAIGFFVHNDTGVPSITGTVTFNNITVKNSSNNYFVSGISLGQFTNANVHLGSAGEQAIILAGNIEVEGNGHAFGIRAGQLKELDVKTTISAKGGNAYSYGISTAGRTEYVVGASPAEGSVINILDGASIYATAKIDNVASIRMGSTVNDVVNIVAGNSDTTWTNKDNGTDMAFTLIGVETLNVSGVADLSGTDSLRGRATSSSVVTTTNVTGSLKVKDTFFNETTGTSNINVTQNGTLGIAPSGNDGMLTSAGHLNTLTIDGTGADEGKTGAKVTLGDKAELEFASHENAISITNGTFEVSDSAGVYTTAQKNIFINGGNLNADPLQLNINNGTVKVTHDSTQSDPLNAVGLTAVITGTATVDVVEEATIKLGNIQGNDTNEAVELVKQGEGTLLLDHNPNAVSAPGNYWSSVVDLGGGTLDIQEGTVKVNNTFTAEYTTNATINVASGSTFENTSSQSGAVVINALSGAGTVTLTSTVSALNVKSGNFDGQITESGTLKKTSDGTLTLTNAAPFSANNKVVIDAGTVALNRSEQTGDYAFNQNLTGTGTLETTLKETTDKFRLGNTVGNAFDGTVSLTKGTIELDAANNTNDESLANATLKLSTNSVADVKSNTTIKNLTTNNGTVKFTADTGKITPETKLIVTNLNVSDGLTLDLTNGITAAIDTTSLGTQNFYDYSNDSSNYQQQLIAATGTVTGNTGNITLSPVAVDSKQSRTINNGTENVGTATFDYNASVKTDGTGTQNGVYLGYGLTEIQADNGKTVTLDATNSATPSLYAQLTGDGGFNFTGSSTQEATVGNSNSNYTGVTEVTGANFTVNAATNNAFGNTSELNVASGATVDFNSKSQTVGGLAGNGEITNGDLTVNSTTANSTFDGTITGTTVLTKDGSQKLTLSGNNTYSGATTISKGTLALTGTGSIANSSKVNVAGTFDISSVTQNASVNDLQGSGNVALGDKEIKVAKGDFSGNISGAGSLTKTGTGTDTLTLSGANTYQGATTINAGTLALTGNGSIENSSKVNVDAAGKFDISGVTESASVKELAGSGNVTLGGQELQVAKGNFSGVINGINGTLTKTGTGTDTLTLSGTNTYSGATNINAGTLELSGTINNTSRINVLENATLDVRSAKTLNNLNSEGTVTFDNALTLAGNADTTISGLNGTADVTKTGNGTTTLGDNTVGKFVQQNGDVTFTGTLTGNYEQVQGAGVFVVDASQGNTATIDGNAEFNGNVELESRLDIQSDLTLNNNSIVSIDLTQFDDVNTDAIINVGGDATIDGHAALNIEHWTPGTDSHTYHLFSAGGNVTGTFDSHNVTFDGSTANNRQGFQIEAANAINNPVTLTTFTKNLNVSRTTDGNWSDSQWGVSDDYKFHDGDYVTFSGSGTQELAVNVDHNVETAGMKVDAGNWLFNGNKITGTVQSGNSADTLTTNDGKLTVTGNTAAATFNNALQFDGGIIVENNAELNLLGNEKVTTQTLTTTAGTKLNLQAVENKVTANGNVTLDGDVQFVYEGDPTQAGTIENVIKTTSGTIQGNFVTTDKLLSSTGAVVLNGNQLNVNYNASSVGSFADSLPNLSGNLVRIGQLIDVQNYADSRLLQQLYSLNSNEQDKFVQILFNQLGPELAADALQLSLWQPTTKIFNRLHEIGSLYENSFRGQCGTGLNYELWFEGFYRSENVSHDAFAGSYKSTRGGLLTGIESRLGQAVRGGFFFGYSNPRVSNSIGRVEADDITFGAYSRIQFGYNTFLNTAIAYGSQDYQYRHNISRNSYNGDAMYASIELFRSVLWKNNWQLTPLFAVDFQKAWSDGFTTADTNQVIAKSSLDQTVLRIGLNSQWQPTYLLNFRTRLQYGIQIGGDLYGSVKTSYLATPDQNHTLTGVNLGKNRLNLGFGTDIYTSNNKRTRLFADYDLDLGERSTAHTGQFGFITNW